MSDINLVITNVLVFSAIAALFLLRWRCRKPEGSRWILSYPVFVKILTVFGLIFVFTGVSLVTEVTPGLVAKLLVIVLSIPAGVLVFMAAAEVFVSETTYDEFRICRCSPWSQSITVPFDEVVRIENPAFRYQYTIHSSDGRTIRICKWTETADEVLGYAQEGLENRTAPVDNVSSRAVA